MRIFLIYNQVSGRKKYRDTDTVLKQLLKQTDHEIVWHYTTPQGSFNTEDPNSFDRILVCGGDGTLKEVVNWVVERKSETPVALIPNGTGNVAAQSLGIPQNLKQAFKLALTHTTQKIDIGQINDREYFVIAAGIGFDAKVMKNTSRSLKRIIGYAAYILGFLKSFFNIRPDKFFIKYDDVATTVKAQSIFVSNFFKFFNFINNPGAIINDGFLNVAIIRSVSAKSFLITLTKMVLGTYAKDWRYEYHKVKHIYIHPIRAKTPIQIDGELVNLPYLDIKIVPKALTIIAPPLQ